MRGPARAAALGAAALAASTLVTSCGGDGDTTLESGGAAEAALRARSTCAIGRSADFASSYVVFFEPETGRRELAEARAAAAEVVGERRVVFVDQEQAHREFSVLFEDDVVAQVTPSELPASIRIVGPTPQEADALDLGMEQFAGIREIRRLDRGEYCDLADPVVRDAAERATRARFGDAEFIVFLDPDVSADREARIRRAILSDPDVRGVTFVDKAGAFEEFTCLFADEPDALEDVTAEDLPMSYRVDVDDLEAAEIEDDSRVQRLNRELLDLSGVREVVVPAVLDDLRAVPTPSDPCPVTGESLK